MPKLDAVLAKRHKIQARISALKKTHAAELAPFEEANEKLERMVKADRANKEWKSLAFDNGRSVSTSVTTNYSVLAKDWAAYVKWCQENSEEFEELVTKKVAKRNFERLIKDGVEIPEIVVVTNKTNISYK